MLVDKYKAKLINDSDILVIYYRRVTRGEEGGGGGVSSVLFRKLEKSALICRKNVLIVVIYG